MTIRNTMKYAVPLLTTLLLAPLALDTKGTP